MSTLDAMSSNETVFYNISGPSIYGYPCYHVSRCNFAMDYLGTFYLNPPHDIMLLDET